MGHLVRAVFKMNLVYLHWVEIEAVDENGELLNGDPFFSLAGVANTA